jgi:hypothetical protein
MTLEEVFIRIVAGEETDGAAGGEVAAAPGLPDTAGGTPA